MTTTSRSGALALASVLLVALNLRPVFPSLSVLLPEIIADTGLTPLAAGVLTTVPVVCLGAFAPVSVSLAARLGIERTLMARHDAEDMHDLVEGDVRFALPFGMEV